MTDMNLSDFLTTSEMDWIDTVRRNAETVARTFALPPQLIGEVSTYSSDHTEPFILIAPRTYHQIRWFVHVGRVHPEPQRKLRKCQLRKRYRTLRRERRRYYA